MKNSESKIVVYSITLFGAGLIASLTINEYIKDFDKYHLLILAPIIFPITGVYLALRGALKNKGYRRLIHLLIMLLNFALILIIFVAFSFSYWQF